MRRGWSLIETMIVLSIAGILAAAGCAIYWDHKHPCLRYGPEHECVGSMCYPVGKVTICQPYTYRCAECLERQP